jgi:general secretion pathway protein F
MQFEIRALKANQGVVLLAIDAPDEAAALEQARLQGVAVLSARRKHGFTGFGRGLRARFPLLLFSQELVALLQAGLSLPETVDAMAEKETRPETRKVLAVVRNRLYEGRSLSQALEDLPQVFPPLYVATVRASERTGDLPEALKRYIGYQERLDNVRKKAVSASIYPTVLLCVGGLVTLFLLGYVVPRFSAIYTETGRDLPFLSRVLIHWGGLINKHGAAVMLGLAAAVVLGVVFRGKVRALAGSIAMRIPALGERVLIYHLARFYRTAGMLLRGGTPIVPALTMVAGLLPVDVRDRLTRAIQRIRDGVSLSTAMTEAGLTTPVAVRMLRVGENSGDMPEMMDRIAVFHDEELARWVDWFTKLFEPLLMAVIGLVIGAIVVLMYLPIFELAGSIQ